MSWLELFEKYGKVLTVLVAVAGAAWAISQAAQVTPRDRDIASLKEQITERNKTISEWKAAYEPYHKQIEQLAADNKTLENYLGIIKDNLKQWQDSLEGWKTQNSALQKSLNTYMTNCSIISEIRSLDKRKSSADSSMMRQYSKEDIEKYKRESDDLQARILVFQQRLTCEPK